MWDLYIFDMKNLPYAGAVKHRWQVRCWMWLNAWRIAELHAIHRNTREHIVR